MKMTETCEVADEAEFDALVDRLTTMFEDKWWIADVEYRYERRKWWHLFPYKVPVKVIAEFDV